MSGSVDIVVNGEPRIVTLAKQRLSLTAINLALLNSDLVDDSRSVLLDESRSRLGVVVVPSARGWALVDAQGRRACKENLRGLLAASIEISVRPECWRLVWALPQNEQGKTTDAAAQALFDPRRPYARLIDRQGDCVTLAVEIDPASPYFEGHFDRAAVLAGVVQVEWAVRFGRELFGIGDDFRCMEALKFQKVVRPGDAVEATLEWNRERATLTFGFSSQAGRHSSGRIMFGAIA
ncbi:MAG: hypothetical protein WBP11_14030 [Dokdonella sp.]